MKLSLPICSILFALLAMVPTSTLAETRMQVAASSSPVLNQAMASAQSLGTVTAGEILFVSRIDGDWAAISPPERFDLWLNKDFIEGNRVVAKVIQIRSGPGIQHPVVGTLKRGAPVMPRGESGDWAKIAPPSSCILWVKKQDLEEVRTHTTPIHEVAPVAEPKKPAPKPEPKTPAATKSHKISTPITKSEPEAPAPSPSSSSSFIVPSSSLSSPPPVKVAPSAPKAAAPKKPIRRQTAPATPTAPKSPRATKPVAKKPVRRQTTSTTTSTAKPRTVKTSSPASKPAAPRTSTPKPSPALRPATALPATQPAPAKPRIRRKRKAPAQSQVVPAPANTVSRKKSKNVEVQVDPALVEDLDLAEMPNQGKPVQVEGEVRNAPFLAASPSRYRLLNYEGRDVEMVCHLHGDSTILRKFVGKDVSIRGREYWVENSDMPVVVVGDIAPLAPRSPANEPVLF